MITKINSNSLESLYKQIFSGLSDSSDKTLLEQIFSENFSDYKAFLPLDEELFEVNADTRVITIPTNFRVNGFVLGDHLAEMLFFIVDRYYDTQDLNDTEIEFLWKTASGREGRTEAAFKNTSFYPLLEQAKQIAAGGAENYTADTNKDKLFFCWPLTNEAISSIGQLQFSVTFYKKISSAEFNTKQTAINDKYNSLISAVNNNSSLTAEEKAEQIDSLNQQKAAELNILNTSGSDLYRLNTLPAVLNISNGLVVETEDNEVENKENELEQLIKNRFPSQS